MDLLREFVVPAKFGLFARATPTTDSMLEIHRRFNGYFANRLKEDLHCTIIYSKKPVNLELDGLGGKDKLKNWRGKASGYSVEFWEGHDKEGYIVLHLSSKDLQELNERFRSRGVVSTFPDYKPHVTLVNPVNPVEYHSQIDQLNRELQISPVDLDFYFAGIDVMTEQRGSVNGSLVFDGGFVVDRRLLEGWGDQEYYVKRVGSNSFEVAVFSTNKQPDDVYQVNVGRKGDWCSCPGFRHTSGPQHKHIQIVKQFLKNGEHPSTFWFDGTKLKWRRLF